MKKHEKKLEIDPKFTVFCKECKHRHIAETGPCIRFGCGCHGLDKPVKKEKK